MTERLQEVNQAKNVHEAHMLSSFARIGDEMKRFVGTGVRALVVAGALGGTLAGGLALSRDDQSPEFSHPDTCQPASDEALAATEALFERPETPGLLNNANGKNGFSAKREEIAKKYGLTLFNYEIDPYVQNKFAAASDPGITADESFELHVDATRHFAALYGIDFSIGRPDDEYPYDITAESAEDLALPESKSALIGLMIWLSHNPVERLEMGSIDHIVAADIPGSYSGTAVVENNTFYVELPLIATDAYPSPIVYAHEHAHHKDAEFCGGAERAQNDPQFASANGLQMNVYVEGVHAGDRGDLLDSESFNRNVESSFSGTLEEFADQKARIATAREYGFKNVLEDKAVVAGLASTPATLAQALSKETPIIRKKVLIELAREYDHNSAVVQYIAETTPYDSIVQMTI